MSPAEAGSCGCGRQALMLYLFVKYLHVLGTIVLVALLTLDNR